MTELSSENPISNSEFRPYRGLDAYKADTSQSFHGRQTQIAELTEVIKKNTVTVFTGKSGIGKSSMLLSGMLPALKSQFILTIYVKIKWDNSDSSPLQQTKQSIAEGMESSNVKWNNVELDIMSLTLWEFFQRLKIGDNIDVVPCLIFDSFGDVFNASEKNEAEREEFKNELEWLIENKKPPSSTFDQASNSIAHKFRVLISIREQWLGELESLNKNIPELKQSRYRLTKMTKSEALDAVLGPAQGIIDPADAELIVDHIIRVTEKEKGRSDTSEHKIEPFLLSLICYQLNELRIRRGEAKITTQLIDEFSLERILENYYEDGSENVSEQGMRILEESLVDEEGNRLRQPVNSLLSRGVQFLDIQELVDNKILRRDVFQGVAYVELIHNVLVDFMMRKLQDRKEDKRRRKVRIRRLRFGILLTVIGLLGAVLVLLINRIQKQEEEYSKVTNYNDSLLDGKGEQTSNFINGLDSMLVEYDIYTAELQIEQGALRDSLAQAKLNGDAESELMIERLIHENESLANAALMRQDQIQIQKSQLQAQYDTLQSKVYEYKDILRRSLGEIKILRTVADSLDKLSKSYARRIEEQEDEIKRISFELYQAKSGGVSLDGKQAKDRRKRLILELQDLPGQYPQGASRSQVAMDNWKDVRKVLEYLLLQTVTGNKVDQQLNDLIMMGDRAHTFRERSEVEEFMGMLAKNWADSRAIFELYQGLATISDNAKEGIRKAIILMDYITDY